MKNNNNEIMTRNSKVYYDPFFDEFFDFAMPRHDNRFSKLMKTDVAEDKDAYNMSMELPGFKKENVSLDLENGYLTITATKDSEVEENKKFIRRERTHESCKRSFYVGEGVNATDISASMEDGILKVKVLKKVEALETTKRIEIK